MSNGLGRIEQLPEPPADGSLEELWEYIHKLYKKLQEAQTSRLADFDTLKLRNTPWVDVRKYGTSELKQNGFAKAISAIGSTEATLLIPNQQDVTDDVAVPSNVVLWVLQTGSLNISSGKTVTINGHIEAGLYQVFEGSGLVVFGSGSVEKISSEWFPGDDIGARINIALVALSNGGKIKLPYGQYSYSTTIDIPLGTTRPYHMEGQGGISSTKLTYTGSGIAINAVGSDSDQCWIKFKDFELVGNENATYGIIMQRNNRFSSLDGVRVCGFSKTGAFGLRINSGTLGLNNNISVRDVQIVENYYGVRLEDLNIMDFFGGVIESNTQFNLVIRQCRNINFFGTTIQGDSAGGGQNVRLETNSTGINFFGCWLESSLAQYNLFIDSSDAKLFGGVLTAGYDGTDYAIRVGGTPTQKTMAYNVWFKGTESNPIAVACSDAPVGNWIEAVDCKYTDVTSKADANIKIFTDEDATPDVSIGKLFKTTNTAETTITMFDGGTKYKTIRIIFGDALTTIDFTGTNLKGNAGVNWTPASGDWMEATFDGTNWYCSVHDCTA